MDAFDIKRLENGIYYLKYKNKLGVEEIAASYRALYDLIGQHDELESYIVVYENDNVSYSLTLDFASVRHALKNAPKIRANNSIFVNFPTGMRIITSSMHRVISGNGSIYFVQTMDEALTKARGFLTNPR